MASVLVCKLAKFRPRDDVVSQRRRRCWHCSGDSAPSLQGLDASPPAHGGHLWHGLGWRSRGPAGLQPPTRARVGGMAGMKRRRRKVQHAERLLVMAFTQRLLHCGSGVPRRSPCRRASPGLPVHCARRAAGNGRWQRPTDPSRGSLGCGGRQGAWPGGLPGARGCIPHAKKHGWTQEGAGTR